MATISQLRGGAGDTEAGMDAVESMEEPGALVHHRSAAESSRKLSNFKRDVMHIVSSPARLDSICKGGSKALQQTGKDEACGKMSPCRNFYRDIVQPMCFHKSSSSQELAKAFL
ncbi:hypothetical protein U9M48_019259 [Paspalum notatum var. saurae]|uniref:Uncharacterized protein n=1 Tax=Paspalum notatum var. saurae TaxID=547442 RepID=A0AAQ3TFA0_PASNO